MTVSEKSGMRGKRRHDTSELQKQQWEFILLHVNVQNSHSYLKTILLAFVTAAERQTEPCGVNACHILIWNTNQLSSLITQN